MFGGKGRRHGGKSNEPNDRLKQIRDETRKKAQKALREAEQRTNKGRKSWGA